MAGLGNPGPRYEATRHNAGFWFADALAAECGGRWRTESRFQGKWCTCHLEGHPIRLLKPTTYMNHSGRSVAAAVRYFDLPAASLLVVHDDLDLPPGTARLKRGGGHGGHNGLRDLIAHLGTRDFLRLRLGIGHPGQRDAVVDYVLSRPRLEEREAIEAAIRDALAVMPLVLAGRLEAAMNALHGKRELGAGS
ncbi:MAG: aminoacyl-tRNA hydrolase [Gammaproteobacteria bacterium]|nr:MAG: aminoacyl-tRNA hydrolase [Gammaproteobacteria bacterium]